MLNCDHCFPLVGVDPPPLPHTHVSPQVFRSIVHSLHHVGMQWAVPGFPLHVCACSCVVQPSLSPEVCHWSCSTILVMDVAVCARQGWEVAQPIVRPLSVVLCVSEPPVLARGIGFTGQKTFEDFESASLTLVAGVVDDHGRGNGLHNPWQKHAVQSAWLPAHTECITKHAR